MPVISRFYGITIYMYTVDHNPPHFHVRYSEFKALVTIRDLKIIAGELPPRVKSMIIEWGMVNRIALYENWERANCHQPLLEIKPLD